MTSDCSDLHANTVSVDPARDGRHELRLRDQQRGSIASLGIVDWLIATYLFLLGLLEPTAYWFVSNYMLAVVAAATALTTLYTGRIRKLTGAPGLLASSFFLVWVVYCSVRAGLTEQSALAIRYLVSVYSIGYIILVNMKSWQQVRLWLIAFICGSGLLAAATIFTSANAGFVQGVRSTGVARQENALGQAMTAAAAAGIMIWPFLRGLRQPLLLMYGGIVLAALAISGSRGSGLSVLVLVCAVLLLEVLPRASRYHLGLAAAAVVGVALAVFRPGIVWSNPLVTRMQRATTINALTDDARWEIYVHAWSVFRDYPFFGVGLGNYQLFNPLYVYTHTAFLELLLGAGVLAAALYYLHVGAVAWRCWRLARQPDATVRWRMFFNGALATVAGIIVQGAFALSYQNKLYVALIFLIMGACALAHRMHPTAPFDAW